MKVCICGKTEKEIDFSEDNAKFIWLIVGVLLVILGFFNFYLSLGLSMIIAVGLTLLIIGRLLAGHKLKCSVRWGVYFIMRVAQYF